MSEVGEQYGEESEFVTQQELDEAYAELEKSINEGWAARTKRSLVKQWNQTWLPILTLLIDIALRIFELWKN